MEPIAKGGFSKTVQAGTGMSLMFATGSRPSASDVKRLSGVAPHPVPSVKSALADAAVPASDASVSGGAAAGSPGAQEFLISLVPGGDAGWLELLANGLAFDMSGLAPGDPAAPVEAAHLFALPQDISGFALEAVRLEPGPHIASAATLLPLVRTMAGLAATLAALPGVAAVCWHPARSWMDPRYFVRLVQGWLAGGAFPALGLTALDRSADGLIRSEGLACFIGQELVIDPQPGESPADSAKLAVRLIDSLVASGPLRAAQGLAGPRGEVLLAEPSADGCLVRIRRGG